MHPQVDRLYLRPAFKLVRSFAFLAFLLPSSSMRADVPILDALRGAMPLGNPKLDIDAHVDAQVSLHPATLKVLKDLPKEAREQLILALKEALPLISAHISAILEQVDNTIDKQIDHFGCTLSGSINNSIPGIEEWLGIGEEAPNDELEKLWAEKVGDFTADTRLHDVAKAHADFVFNIAKYRCRTMATGAPETLQDLQMDFRQRWAVWAALERRATLCNSPRTCLTALQNETRALFEAANPIDREAIDPVYQQVIDADYRLAVRARVPNDRHPFGDVTTAPFEAPLLALFRVQNHLAISRVNRERRAKAHLDLAEHNIGEGETWIGRAGHEITTRDDRDKEAFQRAGVALREAEQRLIWVKSALPEAGRLDARLGPAVEEIWNRYKSVEKRFPSLKAEWDQWQRRLGR